MEQEEEEEEEEEYDDDDDDEEDVLLQCHRQHHCIATLGRLIGVLLCRKPAWRNIK